MKTTTSTARTTSNSKTPVKLSKGRSPDIGSSKLDGTPTSKNTTPAKSREDAGNEGEETIQSLDAYEKATVSVDQVVIHQMGMKSDIYWKEDLPDETKFCQMNMEKIESMLKPFQDYLHEMMEDYRRLREKSNQRLVDFNKRKRKLKKLALERVEEMKEAKARAAKKQGLKGKKADQVKVTDDQVDKVRQEWKDGQGSTTECSLPEKTPISKRTDKTEGNRPQTTDRPDSTN